jgi:hypothetical protein
VLICPLCPCESGIRRRITRPASVWVE